jgi:deoxyribose-phosphate aldolase
VQSKETVKESKLDKLRLEVEQMREMVNKFKVDETPELNKENISETNKTVPTSQKEFVKQQRIPSVPRYQEY